MRIQSVVLFFFMLLTAVVGWLIAQVAGPKLLILLIGAAIGLIVGAPVSLLLAHALGSQAVREEDYQPRSQKQAMPPVYPQVIVAPPVAQQLHQQWLPTYEKVHPYDEQALLRPIRFLGEE